MSVINREIRDLLCEIGSEETIVFDAPDYDEAIIGATYDGNAVYDYQLMVHCLMEKDNISEEEAIDFIEYNTIRSIPYAGEYAPIVMYTFDNMFDNQKHGKWIYDHWCEFKCSECGHFSDSKPYRGRENYCPNCGAKMDLEG